MLCIPHQLSRDSTCPERNVRNLQRMGLRVLCRYCSGFADWPPPLLARTLFAPFKIWPWGATPCAVIPSPLGHKPGGGGGKPKLQQASNSGPSADRLQQGLRVATGGEREGRASHQLCLLEPRREKKLPTWLVALGNSFFFFCAADMGIRERWFRNSSLDAAPRNFLPGSNSFSIRIYLNMQTCQHWLLRKTSLSFPEYTPVRLYRCLQLGRDYTRPAKKTSRDPQLGVCSSEYQEDAYPLETP